MLTQKEIKSRFDLDEEECESADDDAKMLDDVQQMGFARGKTGLPPYEDAHELDIEHVASLLFVAPAKVQKLYDAAHAEGLKARA